MESVPAPHHLQALMQQLQSLETSMTSILMEAALKMTTLTDVDVFMIVDTKEGRRFAGKPHFCEAFRHGSLAASVNDVEMRVDPSISALHSRSNLTFGHVPSPAPFYPSARKRAHDEIGFGRPVKTRRQSPGDDEDDVEILNEPSSNNVDEEFDEVVCKTEDSLVESVVVDGPLTPFPTHSLVDSRTRDLPHPRTPTLRSPQQKRPPGQLAHSQNPFHLGDIEDETLLTEALKPFEAPEPLVVKMAACVEYAKDPQVDHNEVSMKIVKSTFYDVAKVIATEFVSLLRSGRLTPSNESKHFLRARLCAVFRAHPQLQPIYARSYAELKPWHYSRTNFHCVVKRILKVKRLTQEEMVTALERLIPNGDSDYYVGFDDLG